MITNKKLNKSKFPFNLKSAHDKLHLTGANFFFLRLFVSVADGIGRRSVNNIVCIICNVTAWNVRVFFCVFSLSKRYRSFNLKALEPQMGFLIFPPPYLNKMKSTARKNGNIYHICLDNFPVSRATNSFVDVYEVEYCWIMLNHENRHFFNVFLD